MLGHVIPHTPDSWTKKRKEKIWVFSVETLMATYTAKKLKFVNIQPTAVSDVRYNCWFNSSCRYVIICTGVVPELSVTACMLLNALNNSISYFSLLQSLFSVMFTTPPTVNAIFKHTNNRPAVSRLLQLSKKSLQCLSISVCAEKWNVIIELKCKCLCKHHAEEKKKCAFLHILFSSLFTSSF